MGRTFILGTKVWEPVAQQLDATLVDIPEGISSEYSVHDFVINTFVEDIGCLVLHADINPQLCMALSMHVRLTPSLPGDSDICPIVFVTDLPHDYLLKQVPYSQIFLTENIYLCSAHELSESLPLFSALRRENYKSDFLDRINLPKPEGDNHSLANQWGASRLYKIVTGKKITNKEYENFDNIQKGLYYKFITRRITTDEAPRHVFCDSVVRGASTKRILLIDDEADKGWSKAIEKLFPTSRFNPKEDVICEKVMDYDQLSEASRRKIETGNYDLFLLDLRMGGSSEDRNMDPTEFSGYKILKRIKRQNMGNQVIMLTASNKAWNLKALVDPNNGASGYFVKESPEYEFSDDLSASNINSFKEDATVCFDRSYLRDFYTFKEKIHSEDNPFIANLRAQMDIAFRMAAQAKDEDTFSYAYLALAQVSEVITNHLTIVQQKPNSNLTYELWLCDTYQKPTEPCLKQFVKGYITETDSKPYNKQIMVAEKFSQKEKMSAIYLQKYGNKDNGLLYIFDQMVKARNAFIHTDTYGQSATFNILTEKDFINDQIFNGPKLIFSQAPFRNLLMEATRRKLLTVSKKTGRFRIDGRVRNNSLGIRLYFETLKLIITNIVGPDHVQ